jgi:hypothetical protein
VRLVFEDSALTLRQGVLPAHDPLEGTKPALTDTTVTALRFRSLRAQDASWKDRWSGADEQGLPAAVEVTLTTARGAGPPVVIPIRTVSP